MTCWKYLLESSVAWLSRLLDGRTSIDIKLWETGVPVDSEGGDKAYSTRSSRSSILLRISAADDCLFSAGLLDL